MVTCTGIPSSRGREPGAGRFRRRLVCCSSAWKIRGARPRRGRRREMHRVCQREGSDYSDDVRIPGCNARNRGREASIRAPTLAFRATREGSGPRREHSRSAGVHSGRRSKRSGPPSEHFPSAGGNLRREGGVPSRARASWTRSKRFRRPAERSGPRGKRSSRGRDASWRRREDFRCTSEHPDRRASILGQDGSILGADASVSDRGGSARRGDASVLDGDASVLDGDATNRQAHARPREPIAVPSLSHASSPRVTHPASSP